MEWMILGIAAMVALVILGGVGLFLLELVIASKLFFSGEADHAAHTEEERESPKKPDPMDEGFENIMGFSVGGKMGFESDER